LCPSHERAPVASHAIRALHHLPAAHVLTVHEANELLLQRNGFGRFTVRVKRSREALVSLDIVGLDPDRFTKRRDALFVPALGRQNDADRAARRDILGIESAGLATLRD